MPLYEYHCTACEERFEKLVPMSRSSSPEPCPTCQTPAKRAISLFASFTRGEDGATSVGGGGCAGCAGGSCATCQ